MTTLTPALPDTPINSLNGKLLLLVDGSSYLYRAFHAMPDLRTTLADGASVPTGAIRGMVNMLQALLKEYPPDLAACVFDAKGETFRNALYAQYKANRSPMPDDLRAQIAPIHEVVQLLGWKTLTVEGVEADDVIGTLAKLAAQGGAKVIISSGDKDLSQLVDKNITIVDTMSGKIRDIAGVTAEFGVPPHLMVDFQTLVGDAVDNVPGVEKVGPKTAAKWLQEYSSLDNLVQKSAEIKGVAGQNLRNSLDWLPQAKALVTIKTDCELGTYIEKFPNLDSLVHKKPQKEGLKAFYTHYGFKGLAKALDVLESDGTDVLHGKSLENIENKKTPLKNIENPLAYNQNLSEDAVLAETTQKAREAVVGLKVEYETIFTIEQLQKWVEHLNRANLVALDTETRGLEPLHALLVGLSVSVAVGQAAYIPLGHDYAGAAVQLPLDTVLQALKPWLENPQAHKVGQNVKFDQHVLANHGIVVKGYVHDTMLQSYVLEAHKAHNLGSLVQRHLGRSVVEYEDLCGKGAQQITMNQVEIDKAAFYACEDAEQTLNVHNALYPAIELQPDLQRIYALEMACSQVLFEMERTGVLLDAKKLRIQSHELGSRIMQLEQQAHELAQQPFNLSSPKQIGEIFFDKLKLPIVKKTATGAPSTDEEVLEKLAQDFPLPAKILEHRTLSKLKSTYTDKLPQLVNVKSARVHTHYAQAVAITGRLASNDPNLQNIPIKTPEGRRIREAFIARDGYCIVSADYSQIELRIMAHLSDDKALLQAFSNGIDVHSATAAEVFGVPLQAVSKEQRRYAKVINFGLIYGMSSYGLAKNLGIDNTAAKNYIARYFERYPGVAHYMQHMKEEAKAKGFVSTVFGRRLYMPEIYSANAVRRAAAERAAINAPMQGTAADLIKMSMVKIQEVLKREMPHVQMTMQVHDELVFEIPKSDILWVKQTIPELMASVAQLKVPLVAEVGVGENWDQAH